MNIKEFYSGKIVLVTGHTGFKGSWISNILIELGAKVVGYSLESPTNPSMFHLTNLEERMISIIGDIRDFVSLKTIFDKYCPQIVFHLAAQPLVKEGYENPLYTYQTNVMGTANVLECSRLSKCVKSIVNITTDKVYQNNEWEWGYRESDTLNGYDPYSNSKSCSELISDSYKKSFFNDLKIPLSTARAGNVIGGGDFSPNRIIPDCIKSVIKNKPIVLRNPNSTRPYQHVLEPIYAYLLIAKKQYEDINYASSYNIGPLTADCVKTALLADVFCKLWGNGSYWITQSDNGPHEANILRLDSSKISTKLGWRPIWSFEQALQKTIEWTKHYLNKHDLIEITISQYYEYLKDLEDKNIEIIGYWS